MKFDAALVTLVPMFSIVVNTPDVVPHCRDTSFTGLYVLVFGSKPNA